MSILSQAIKSYKSGTPILTVAATAIAQIESWGTGLLAKAEQDPAVNAAITAAVADAKAAAGTAITWADTAMASTLADFGDEVAGLVVKYGQAVLGDSASMEAATTLVGALVDAGVATLHHEALALQTQITGATPVPAASGAASASPQS